MHSCWAMWKRLRVQRRHRQVWRFANDFFLIFSSNFFVIDIDECAVSTSNRCHIIDRCINIPGAYNCKPKICSIGYVLNHQTGNCDDIDECLKKPCARNQKCVNFPGSYYCDCAYGYRKDVYSKKDCRDINECVEHPGESKIQRNKKKISFYFQLLGICEQSCMNTVGSYRCGCKNGFRISQDNRTCSDVDECEEKYSSLLCPTPAQCKNTLGSFRCSCPSGLRLISGRYCDGKTTKTNFQDLLTLHCFFLFLRHWRMQRKCKYLQ